MNYTGTSAIVATIVVVGSGGCPTMKMYPQTINGLYYEGSPAPIEEEVMKGVLFSYDRGDSSGLFDEPRVVVTRNPLPTIPEGLETNVLKMLEVYHGANLGGTVQLTTDGSVAIS